MDNNKRFFVVQQAGRQADIYIFGDITPYRWIENDVSAMSLTQQIKGLDVDRINVHIDSYGGAVSEGWAIYNVLLQHKAEIVTYADGFVASAALYPFMAGDKRVASTLSAFYFHEVMTGAEGYAKDLRAAADMAEFMTDVGINAFTERAGMDADDVRQMMANETWLNAWDALDKGLVTAVEQDSGFKFAQSAKQTVMERFVQGIPCTIPPADPVPPADPEPKRNTILQMFKNCEM